MFTPPQHALSQELSQDSDKKNPALQGSGRISCRPDVDRSWLARDVGNRPINESVFFRGPSGDEVAERVSPSGCTSFTE